MHNHGLPGIVMRSVFLLSRDTDGVFQIYEVQEKLNDYINVDREKIDKYVTTLNYHQKKNLLNESRKFFR